MASAGSQQMLRLSASDEDDGIMLRFSGVEQMFYVQDKIKALASDGQHFYVAADRLS
jgi:hypothetical protein